MERVQHTFPPVFDGKSSILVLGTFPSVKSRESGFYYGHPQNRFWRLIATLFKEQAPVTVQEKKDLLLAHGIAIWDVINSCEIVGSSDSSIQNVVPNDIPALLKQAPIKVICANGATAAKLYNKYCYPLTDMACNKLPSTSPANATCSLERLILEWGKLIRDVSLSK